MAFAPIALTIPQYDKLTLANWWLKAYDQGTTTPLDMATDATGGTLLVKAELDSEGFPITSGSARFIPFINGDYDLWCFPTATEADANDTTNAIQFADNLNADPESSISVVAGSYTVADKSSAVLLTPVSGKSLVVESTDGGLFVAKTGAAPGTYSDDGSAFCGTIFIPTGGNGSTAWARDYNDGLNVTWFGAVGGNIDNTATFTAAFAAGKNIIVNGDYSIEGPAVIPSTVESIDFTGSTITRHTPASTASLFTINSDELLMIKGGKFTSTEYTGHYFLAGTGNVKNITFDGCFMENSLIAIDIDFSDHLVVKNCKFEYCAGAGVYSNNAYGTLIDGCKFLGDGTYDTAGSMLHAMVIQATSTGTSEHTKIVNNIIDTTGDSSIFTRAFASCTLRHVIISNNTIVRAGKTPIRFSNPSANDNAVIENCSMHNNIIRGYSLWVSGRAIGCFRDNGNTNSVVRNINISDNIIDGLDEDGTNPVLAENPNATTDGISVGYVSELVISGNTIRNTYGAGIKIQKATNVTCVGNTVHSAWINAQAFGLEDAAVEIDLSSSVQYDGIVTATNTNGGVWVKDCWDSQINGVSSGNDDYGYRIDYASSATRVNSTIFRFTALDNAVLARAAGITTGDTIATTPAADDLVFLLDSVSNTLVDVYYYDSLLTSGLLSTGDTTKRDKYFFGNIGKGFIYHNTTTSELQVYTSAGAWKSVAIA